MPNTHKQWVSVSEEFKFKWNFPNVIHAIDGKHIQIEAPPNSGSYFFNYKSFHRVLLLAIAGANAKFIYIDVSCNGRKSDGGYLKTVLYIQL